MTTDRALVAHQLLIQAEERFRVLWAYRAWYRSHTGWIPQSRTDDRAELRRLITALKAARDAARLAQPDPIDDYKRCIDLEGGAVMWLRVAPESEGELREAYGR